MSSSTPLSAYSSSGDEFPDTKDVVPPVVGPNDYLVTQDATTTEDAASVEDTSGSENSSEQSLELGNMASRAYQLEMLEESLKQNIIVAMDTGSGKTRVAVLRIAAELERSAPEKICWFLANTVDLCRQQFHVLSTQIPSAHVKMFIGEDGIDSWSEKKTWDKALYNVRVVVSSYQILLDALGHAFVKMHRLALIVFDEAHNCAKNHAGRRIMNEFYRPIKEVGGEVPAILGLTASPIMGSKLGAMEELELTLDAICKTPTRHREELLSQVKRPEMFTCLYLAESLGPEDLTPAIVRLEQTLAALDIHEDPYVKSLKAQNTDKSRRKLEKALEKNDTYVKNETRSFSRRSQEILRELGPWAADYYIAEVVRRVTDRTSTTGKPSTFRTNWDDDEMRYMMSIMRDVMPLENGSSPPKRIRLSTTGHITLSDKAQKLVDILTTYEGIPFGIIFVKERATAAILAHLLSSHPAIQDRYKVASLVGGSRFHGRRQDFLDLTTAGNDSLHRFREGEANLLVATSVIEEGIDIPSCNIIICVDEPKSLKSFIQRRGRARDQNSQIHLLLESSAKDAILKWEDLEAEMKKRYEDEMRVLPELEALEDESPDNAPFSPLLVETTQARLTIDDAKPHLEHFCATLSSSRYIDYRPDFIIHENGGLLSATVQLPISLPADLRKFHSATSWKSEKNACKDAAFQAYKALYEAKLVNDNLLPVRESVNREMEGRPSMKDVREQINPWRKFARAWNDLERNPAAIQRRLLALKDENGRLLCEVELLLPLQVTFPEKLEFYWNHHSTIPWTFEIDADVAMSQDPDPGFVNDGRSHTSTLLALAYGHRWPISDRHQLLRFASNAISLDTDTIGATAIPGSGSPQVDGIRHYLIRESNGYPWYYESWTPRKPPFEQVKAHQGGKPHYGFDEVSDDVPHFLVSKWPRIAGAAHPVQSLQSSSGKPYTIPAAGTKIDNVPLVYAQLGMLIPSLTHTLETHLVAAELLESTRLKALRISDQSLVATALSAPNAGRHTDYERIEFLGDSVLKFCTTINVSAQNLKFPEGILSLLKDRIVSNSRLSRAAISFGLDGFIATHRFSLKDWRTLYNTDLLVTQPDTTRNMSTKTLADVVEALIAVAFLDGGMPAALHCISIFLPDNVWWDIPRGGGTLLAAAAQDAPLPPPLEPLERLVGYTFTRKALLVEAMTHGSYNVPSAPACLERLEFIGDAVLDFVVVQRLFNATELELKNFDMHLFRTALVNGDFLAFVAMEWAVDVPSFEVETDPSTTHKYRRSKADPSTHEVPISRPFWSFMRHANPGLAAEQRATAARYAELREEICKAMATGARYPWAQLARLRAQKCYSDAFESLIGAVWVDSGGSLEDVAKLLERCGIMAYMRRMVKGEVWVLHPKEELGRLAGQQKVQYSVEVVEAEEGGAPKEYVCTVQVGDMEPVVVGGGVTREESKTKAADQVVRSWGLNMD